MGSPTSRTATAITILERFAERTGVAVEGSDQRYLWTDAFAVCTWLGLAGRFPRALVRARDLVHDVHRVLGRHRPDDVRCGWISGLPEEAGALHPTRGGLRIGKPLPERPPRAPLDERQEWDRDGQYLHYLTRWMHALDQTAWATGNVTFNRWARELAETAFRAFSYYPPGGRRLRLYWKLSIDLSRPQMLVMGQHDPLDLYVTSLELASSARVSSTAADVPDLDPEIDALSSAVSDGDWATDDPLGMGGILADAYRVHQLERRGARVATGLLGDLLTAAATSLPPFQARQPWRAPANRRLPFRELGLAIGMAALTALDLDMDRDDPRRRLLDGLLDHRGLANDLVAFWLEDDARQSAGWRSHRDINDVMLATALAPEGYLVLGGTPTRNASPEPRQ